MEILAAGIQARFREIFGGSPLLVRSPGRVNLIGEHTDYNAGFVLPAAIDKAILFAIRERPGRRCRLFAADLNERHEFDLDGFQRDSKHWPNYLMGVVDQILREGYTLGGFDCVFGGNIPIGAGLSSSAALEAGLAAALNEIFELNIDKLQLVHLARRAENEFVGVQCGIMDQFINIFGMKDRAVLLDCRSLEYQYYPFDGKELSVVLCDTGVRRELASSEYNIRRAQCESAVSILQQFDKNVKSLRDASLDLLEEHHQALGALLFRRSAYVVRENLRVLAACGDLQRGDWQAFGQRIYQSHEGLRDDYEVSSPELNLLIELAAGIPGVLGARMMGAGFGGCTINLVKNKQLENFTGSIEESFRRQSGKNVAIHVARIQAGTSVITAQEAHV